MSSGLNFKLACELNLAFAAVLCKRLSPL